jgi:hypothetical protein
MRLAEPIKPISYDTDEPLKRLVSLSQSPGPSIAGAALRPALNAVVMPRTYGLSMKLSLREFELLYI